MSAEILPLPEDAIGEISALIETLHQIEQRLEELTAGQVDTVTRSDGRTFLLRRAQESLRFSDAAKQTAILNALPADIAMLDSRGVIVSVNEKWRLFAAANAREAREFAVGGNYLEVCDRATGNFSAAGSPVADGIRAVLSGGAKVFAIEYPRHSAARTRWFLLTASPLADGTPQGAVVMHSDITERRQAEDEVLLLNQTLEQRVAERTAQLQFANEELQAFSYSVSHDLRAPLRHITSFVEVLTLEAEPPLSEVDLRHLAVISGAAKRMGDLIDDLLAFSRLGHAQLQKTDVDLNQLVPEILADLAPETKGRHVLWEIHPLAAVRADRALMRIVLINLISNAVKFTGARAEAKIEIGCVDEGSGETVVFIRDNGAGFDPRYGDKLFGVFHRLHSAAEFEGTGIGLANVKRIIHRHGGRVWAEGAVDRGATFYFSIKKTGAAETDDAADVGPGAPAGAPGTGLAPDGPAGRQSGAIQTDDRP